MKERRLLLFLTFIPLVMAVFIWDLDVEFTNRPDPEPQEAVQDLPLTVLEQAQLTQFDQNGMQSQRVSGETLTSFELDEQIQITRPTFELRTEQGHWTATSQRGVFYQSDNMLSLDGNVTLQKYDTEAPVIMQTEQLNYYPDVRLAQTSTPVSIQTTGHEIQSDGISVDLANSVYVLTSQVRSRHEPL